jgi:hypothetical protein
MPVCRLSAGVGTDIEKDCVECAGFDQGRGEGVEVYRDFYDGAVHINS